MVVIVLRTKLSHCPAPLIDYWLSSSRKLDLLFMSPSFWYFTLYNFTIFRRSLVIQHFMNLVAPILLLLPLLLLVIIPCCSFRCRVIHGNKNILRAAHEGIPGVARKCWQICVLIILGTVAWPHFRLGLINRVSTKLRYLLLILRIGRRA